MTKKQKEKFHHDVVEYLYNDLKNDESIPVICDIEKDNRRNHTLNIRFNDTEWEQLEKAVHENDYKSKAEYVRACLKARMDVSLDRTDLVKATHSIQTVSSNINQIALRVNQTHRIFADDIEQLKKGVNEIWQSLISIQSNVRLVKDYNTSLMELKPETATLWSLLVARQNQKKQSNNSDKSQPAELEEVPSLPTT